MTFLTKGGELLFSVSKYIYPTIIVGYIYYEIVFLAPYIKWLHALSGAIFILDKK